MARVLARAWPSSCIRFSSETPPSRPQVGRQADLGEGLAVEVEGQALDGAGAEVPAGDDALRFDAAERLGHGRRLLDRDEG